MTNTSYKDTGAYLDISGWHFGISAYVNYDSVSRSNNTVTVNGANGVFKITTSNGGNSFYGADVTGRYDFPSGTIRRTQSFGNGTFNVGDVRSSSENTFNITVGNTATSVSVRAGARYGGDSITYTSSSSIAVPSAGSPTGQAVSASSVKPTSASLDASISNWGTNCTAGTGQRIEYKASTSGTWTNLAYSTSSSHSNIVTGLKPHTDYNVRTYTINGAGLTGNSSTITFTTQSVVGLTPLLMRLLN